MSKTIFQASFHGLPPTINHYYFHRTGHAFKRPEAQKWQHDTCIDFALKYANQAPYYNPVELFISFTTKDKKRWDIDNRVKILQDCLTLANIIHDDSQILSLHVKRSFGSTTKTFLRLTEYYNE